MKRIMERRSMMMMMMMMMMSRRRWTKRMMMKRCKRGLTILLFPSYGLGGYVSACGSPPHDFARYVRDVLPRGLAEFHEMILSHQHTRSSALVVKKVLDAIVVPAFVEEIGVGEGSLHLIYTIHYTHLPLPIHTAHPLK